MKKVAKIDPKEIEVPNICFSLANDESPRARKFRNQRLERGFDDSEMWNLDSTIAQFILPRLKRYKHLGKKCHPSELTYQQWQKYLSKMIIAFELILEDKYSFKNEVKIDEGLILFSQYLRSLWL